MKPRSFENLGYKIDVSLSTIESKQAFFWNLKKVFYKSESIDIEAKLKTTIAECYQLLNESSDLQPYILRGYEYRKKKEDPSVRLIITHLNNEIDSNNYLQKLVEQAIKIEQNNEFIRKITNVFENMAFGYALYRFIPYLENMYSTVSTNKSYFSKTSLPLNSEEFEHELWIVSLINECGLSPQMTIKNYELKERKIDQLAEEFMAIKSPDSVKTISDRLEMLNNKVKQRENELWESTAFHRKGYLLAIRDKNPTVYEVLNENSVHIKNDPWSRILPGFNDSETNNSKIILHEVLEGYAFAHHISFLERKLKPPAPLESTSPEKLVLLKWNGQKNQLYDVLRELKIRGLISNSYEDLALFLKQNVEIFQSTSLSTIQKEIGKDKRPPKGKRIDLQI